MASISSRLEKAHELMLAGASQDAIAIASEVMDEDIDNGIASAIITQAFVDLDRPGFARLFGEHSTSKFPNMGEAWVNLGNAYHVAYEPEKAIECQKKALELRPDDFAAMNNIALSYVNLSEPEESIRWCDKAEKIRPRHVEVLETKGYAQLMLHQWEEGWKNYNVGVGRSSDRKRRSYGDKVEPVWNGAKGKTVVLYGEQGVGEELSFTSVVPQMKKDCNLIIETQASLERLFKRSFDVPVYGTRYAHGLDWPEKHKIDAVISIGQAMALYRKKDSDFPGTPYLVADEQRRVWWRAILDTFPGKKIGIAWNGGTMKTGKKRRSIPLKSFLPILDSTNTYISLEYKDPMDELNTLQTSSGIQIQNFSRYINHKDYDDTAALVSELDGIITVTTAVADLCGALGVECDVLVPERPHWRFYGEGNSTIWFNSLNIVRQNGTWDDTLKDAYA